MSSTPPPAVPQTIKERIAALQNSNSKPLPPSPLQRKLSSNTLIADSSVNVGEFRKNLEKAAETQGSSRSPIGGGVVGGSGGGFKRSNSSEASGSPTGSSEIFKQRQASFKSLSPGAIASGSPTATTSTSISISSDSKETNEQKKDESPPPHRTVKRSASIYDESPTNSPKNSPKASPSPVNTDAGDNGSSPVKFAPLNLDDGGLLGSDKDRIRASSRSPTSAANAAAAASGDPAALASRPVLSRRGSRVSRSASAYLGDGAGGPASPSNGNGNRNDRSASPVNTANVNTSDKINTSSLKVNTSPNNNNNKSKAESFSPQSQSQSDKDKPHQHKVLGRSTSDVDDNLINDELKSSDSPSSSSSSSKSPPTPFKKRTSLPATSSSSSAMASSAKYTADKRINVHEVFSGGGSPVGDGNPDTGFVNPMPETQYKVRASATASSSSSSSSSASASANSSSSGSSPTSKEARGRSGSGIDSVSDKGGYVSGKKGSGVGGLLGGFDYGTTEQKKTYETKDKDKTEKKEIEEVAVVTAVVAGKAKNRLTLPTALPSTSSSASASVPATTPKRRTSVSDRYSPSSKSTTFLTPPSPSSKNSYNPEEVTGTGTGGIKERIDMIKRSSGDFSGNVPIIGVKSFVRRKSAVSDDGMDGSLSTNTNASSNAKEASAAAAGKNEEKDKPPAVTFVGKVGGKIGLLAKNLSEIKMGLPPQMKRDFSGASGVMMDGSGSSEASSSASASASVGSISSRADVVGSMQDLEHRQSDRVIMSVKRKPRTKRASTIGLEA